MDVEDARLAANSGADALIVSNHGGRQLDGAPSSIAALPAMEQDRVVAQIRKLIETSPDLAGKSEVTFPYETAAFSCTKLG